MRAWNVPQRLGPGLLVGLTAFAGGCTHHEPPAGETDVLWPSRAADSVRAVAAARVELAKIVHDGPWVVAAFIRDTGGVLIDFAPDTKQTLGGGGRVRVTVKGAAAVMELFQ